MWWLFRCNRECKRFPQMCFWKKTFWLESRTFTIGVEPRRSRHRFPSLILVGHPHPSSCHRCSHVNHHQSRWPNVSSVTTNRLHRCNHETLTCRLIVMTLNEGHAYKLYIVFLQYRVFTAGWEHLQDLLTYYDASIDHNEGTCCWCVFNTNNSGGLWLWGFDRTSFGFTYLLVLSVHCCCCCCCFYGACWHYIHIKYHLHVCLFGWNNL